MYVCVCYGVKDSSVCVYMFIADFQWRWALADHSIHGLHGAHMELGAWQVGDNSLSKSDKMKERINNDGDGNNRNTNNDNNNNSNAIDRGSSRPKNISTHFSANKAQNAGSRGMVFSSLHKVLIYLAVW